MAIKFIFEDKETTPSSKTFVIFIKGLILLIKVIYAPIRLER